MTELRVESTRGGVVESIHRVSVAVVNADGALIAMSGNPELHTFWRSAAKPFQAIPLVLDGAADRFGFSAQALALACASHSSELVHRTIAAAMLQQLGLTEADLACGPHPPLTSPLSQVPPDRGPPTPIWSNCSGKHAGMLALALMHRWPIAGYERAGHPVQDRLLAEVSRWTGVPQSDIGLGTDGCTAVSYALPLTAMARAYAQLARSDEIGAVRVREAMLSHPELVAGSGRCCTDVMLAGKGRVLVKLGADGVYGGAVLPDGLGLAIKVEDGDLRCAAPALLAVLRSLTEEMAPSLRPLLDTATVRRHGQVELRSTRGVPVGALRATGSLRYSAPSRGNAMTATHSR